MQKRTSVLLTFIFIVTLVSGLYIFTDWFSQITGYFLGEDEATKLAKCLDGKNAEFYGTKYCADCEKQKELFGPAFRYVDFKDCGKEKELCQFIREIPAWYIDKSIVYGFKSFPELRELSGCVDE